jgi:hypothetical protein
LVYFCIYFWEQKNDNSMMKICALACANNVCT